MGQSCFSMAITQTEHVPTVQSKNDSNSDSNSDNDSDSDNDRDSYGNLKSDLIIYRRGEETYRRYAQIDGSFDIRFYTMKSHTMPIVELYRIDCCGWYNRSQPMTIVGGHNYFAYFGPLTSLALLRTFADAVADEDSKHGKPQLVDPAKKWKLSFTPTSEGDCFSDHVMIQISPRQEEKNIPAGMSWMDVVKMLTIREFHCLAFRVSLEEYFAIASHVGVTSNDLIVPLLKEAWKVPVKAVTAKYMELVHTYGCQPDKKNGHTLLKLLFSDLRFIQQTPMQRTKSTESEEYYDEIIAHWYSCGIDICPDDQGDIVTAIFYSWNPRYLHWFLTKYPHIDLSLPGHDMYTGKLCKYGPYKVLDYHYTIPAHIIDNIDDVLYEFGRESIIDHHKMEINGKTKSRTKITFTS